MGSSMRSSRSGSQSSAASRPRLDGVAASTPIPYREKPLEYLPTFLCKCREKAARWISWCDDNLGRRYFTCFRRRVDGCDLWVWAEESTTTPFVRQLLLDLRDMVWRLRREKAELVAAVQDERAKLEQTRNEEAALLIVAREELQEKGRAIDMLNARVSILEKQRKWLAYAFAGCATLCAMNVMLG